MSKPNSAARNTMSKLERQCYDWGFEDAEERIIKLLEELKEFWSEKMTLEYGEATMINVDEAIALIKGETNV
jgi:hypothetical protein